MTLQSVVEIQVGSVKPTILGLMRNDDEDVPRDKVTMSIVKIQQDGGFIDKLIEAAIEKDRRTVYTRKGGLYTGPLTTVIQAKRKGERYKSAALELASHVVVTHFPAWVLDCGVTLHFYLGENPYTVNNFATGRVLSVEEPDHH